MPITATGGTITELNGYRIHAFTSSGTLSVTGSGNVEYLVVAGGGVAVSPDGKKLFVAGFESSSSNWLKVFDVEPLKSGFFSMFWYRKDRP